MTAPVVRMGIERPGEVRAYREDLGALADGRFRVQTLQSGISPGTELTVYTGINRQFNGTWPDDRRLFYPLESYPVRRIGYENVGLVVESSVDGVLPGQLVAGEWGHAEGSDVLPDDLWYDLPVGLDPRLGIYLPKMGPVCMNGILHAADDLLGEPVHDLRGALEGRVALVTGAGVVGQLHAHMARWAGAQVIVADRNPNRLAAAADAGLGVVNTAEPGPARATWKLFSDCSERPGADFALQCTGAPELLDLCLKALRPQGTVVDLGFYQTDARGVWLGFDAHHLGLRIVFAQVRRVPSRQARKAGWNRSRLVEQTAAFLADQGNLILRHLFTDELPLCELAEGYRRLQAPDTSTIQVLLSPAA